ncbi:WYL domain-containing protein [Paenibacillus allorhizosphaerae]|uniref:WYL domain-containing protein n=1 Tax=Paenibacillus allorhizosphaerae TaxID=2849866 RepID=A0ABN7TT97_9BACL|nr:WYL domain-containing protein [Paenibacillus allorhizosphaerae]CAG7654895.1 hypothetical protein PAECIP111802_05929 [Paenibacillus allorhizosphaerae]
MEQELQRYMGRTVEMIYLGRDNQITQRRVDVHSMNNGIVKAYCHERNAPRVFRVENILAVSVASRKWAG